MVSNHQGDLLFLRLDFNCNSGLKFNGEVVGKEERVDRCSMT